LNLAVIPARGGSKRIPRKNIKDFCGKPMIAWSIEAALESGVFDLVVVSTDDEEIAEVARQQGAETPFLRPAALSDDYVDTDAVVAHAIQWLEQSRIAPQAACCIYATAPFIQGDDLRRGRDALYSGDWDFAFTATDFAAPIFRSFRQTKEGGVEMLYPEHYFTRSQDLPVALHDAGQFYWGRPSAWIDQRRVFSHRSVPVIIPRYRVQDIDTDEDWIRAEFMFRAFDAMKGRGT
jgi:N-acylneuraminate cytidylyltransferase